MKIRQRVLPFLERGFVLAALLLLLSPGLALAGGQLTTVSLDGAEPGPVPGSLVLGTAPLHWDARCMPVELTLNTLVPPTADPPLGVETTKDVLRRALAAWTDIPTSYIDMRLGDAEVQRPRLGPFDYTAFDFVNELNFLSGADEGYVAISPSVSLVTETTFVAGTDIDGDGDPDVFDPAAEGIDHCADVDSDGDFDVPAGTYDAGTIFDNDVSFNNVAVWTVGPPTAVFGEFDLEGTAVHELGHSHGLSHTAVDRLSPSDGTDASMIPFIFSNDPIQQEGLRTPSGDDVAWSSFVYPEGSAASGPAALEPGDVAFGEVYGVVRGEVTHGESGLPLAGGHVIAVAKDTGEVAASHATGAVRLLYIPGVFLGFDLQQPAFHLVSGGYTLPLPEGEYNLVIEALDGAPVAGSQVSVIASAGGLFGQLDFDEEFFLEPGKDEFEPWEVEVEAGEQVTGIDHTTSVGVDIDPFDTVGLNTSFDLDNVGFIDAPPGRLYAVEFPADEIELLLGQLLEPTGAAIRTFQTEKSAPASLARVVLVSGEVVGGNAVLDLDDPIAEAAATPGYGAGVAVADNDYAPVFFHEPKDVAEDLAEAIDDGAESFFLVAELPASFPGQLGFPPWIGLDAGQQAGQLDRSWLSDDGGTTFTRQPFWNYMFRLTFR